MNSKFDTALTWIENAIIATTFLLLTLIAFVNVVSRYALHGSISWSAEVITGLAVYMIMVGVSAAIRTGAHPDFAAIRDASKGALRKVFIVVIGVAMVVFLLLLLWLGWDMVVTQMARGRTTPALGMPQWILSFALPFGAFFGILRTIQITIDRLRHPELLDAQPDLLPGS